ncbi:unnamed protein product [Chrysoparadoxa australica]
MRTASPTLPRGVGRRKSSIEETCAPSFGSSQESTTTSITSAGGMLAAAVGTVKSAITMFELSVALPYEEVPPELCAPNKGQDALDLNRWSILVTDNTLKTIAAKNKERVHLLAEEQANAQVEGHVKDLSLEHVLLSVDDKGQVVLQPDS